MQMVKPNPQIKIDYNKLQKRARQMPRKELEIHLAAAKINGIFNGVF